MDKKSKISDHDKQLFRDAVEQMTPKNKDRERPAKPSKNIGTHHIEYDQTATTVSSNEELFFARSGIQYKITKNLKSGNITIAGRVDLHGYTADEAKQVLLNFISQHSEEGHRYLLVVHGKGYRSKEDPVLKNRVNTWLRQIPNVLAFCSAKPKDGGTGAVYVLIK